MKKLLKKYILILFANYVSNFFLGFFKVLIEG